MLRRTSEITLAKEIAAEAHADQVDKAGKPYIGHLARVASYADPDNTDAVAAAWLHDTVEDTELTAAELLRRGVPADVVAAVELLTRHKDQDPAQYYRQIREAPLALEVKLADIADNSDPDRLAQLPEAQRERLQHKYAKAYEALGADGEDGRRRRERARS